MSEATLIFLGDEATAAGLRLAGVETHAVGRGDVAQAYAEHAPRADVLLLGAEVAAELGRLDRDLARPRPLVMVLPGLSGGVRPTNPAESIRRRLGIREDGGGEGTA